MVNSFFIDYIIQDFCLRNTTSSARIEQHFWVSGFSWLVSFLLSV